MTHTNSLENRRKGATHHLRRHLLERHPERRGVAARPVREDGTRQHRVHLCGREGGAAHCSNSGDDRGNAGAHADVVPPDVERDVAREPEDGRLRMGGQGGRRCRSRWTARPPTRLHPSRHLGRRVRHKGGLRTQAAYRCDVDDRATPPRGHEWDCVLHHERCGVGQRVGGGQ